MQQKDSLWENVPFLNVLGNLKVGDSVFFQLSVDDFLGYIPGAEYPDSIGSELMSFYAGIQNIMSREEFENKQREEFEKMKMGSSIINASRGGIIDEEELIRNLDNGKIKFAGLDTFENEPRPSVSILMHPKISLTPHIGAATSEAQERIGEELAKQICDFFKIWKDG